MKGRRLAVLLLAGILLALAGQTVRWRDRMAAARILRDVEVLTLNAAVNGAVPHVLLAANIEQLQRAARLDRLDVGLPIALGSQYLLAGQADPAIEAYEEALRIEPRPEIYLNLARAHAMAGREDQARRNFDLAVRLDPRLGRDDANRP